MPAEKETKLQPPSDLHLPSPAFSHDEDARPVKEQKLEGDSNASSSDTAYAEHGPGIDHHIHPQEDVLQARPELWWSGMRHKFREPLAEFFGVFIMILFGDG